MKTSYTLAPTHTTYTYTNSQRQLKPSVLAPYSTQIQEAYHYELSDEELEVIRVGLFVDILKYEYREHKGFASSEWKTLFKYWKNHIFECKHYSASKEYKKINVHKLVKEGVLTVETQKRLYKNEAWYPNFIENEREQTIEWLKQLDQEDVEYTLYTFFEGGLEYIRDKINERQRRIEKPPVEVQRPELKEINEPIVLDCIVGMFKKMKGFVSTVPNVLAEFAVGVKENPGLEIELRTHLKKKKSKLAPSENIEGQVNDLKVKILLYNYWDYESAFEKRQNIGKAGKNVLAPGNRESVQRGFSSNNPLAPEDQYSDHFTHVESSNNQASFSHQLAPGSLQRPASAHPLSSGKSKPSSTRKIEYIKLSQKCYRAIQTLKKYSDFPEGFDSFQNLLPQVPSLLLYLSHFCEKRESSFSFPFEEFLSFCLQLYFPIFDDKTFPALSLKMGEKYKVQEALEKVDRSKSPLSESELRMYIGHFNSIKMIFVKLHIISSEFNGYCSRSGKELYYFWERITAKEKDKLGLWLFEVRRNEDYMPESEYKKMISERIECIERFYKTLEESKKSKEEQEKTLKKEKQDKLKAKYAHLGTKNLHESKQTRWALGKKLLEIEKKFPLDPVVKKMIKIEFTENPLKKFDLEYEAHNEEEELKRKLGKVSMESMKVHTGQKLSLDEVIKLQANKLRFIEMNAIKTQEKIKEEKTKEQEGPMFKSVRTLVKGYLEFKKTGTSTVSAYLSSGYYSLKSQFPFAVEKHFPFKNYGCVNRKDDGTKTFAKAYPTEFKHYFFAAFRSLLKTPKGLIILKSMPALIWAPSSKSRCTVHVDICPPNCMYVTLNKKVIRQALKSEQYSVAWHSKLRPFFRPDMIGEKEKIFMSYSDARECRFEPAAGSKVPPKHLALTFKQFSEIRNKINPDEAPNLNMWVNKLGVNLRSSEPGLFKLGVYKQAKALYIQNKFKESKDLLIENFNIPYILNYFEPGKNRPNINEKPSEDFNKPSNLDLNTQVYELYCAIKHQFRQAHSQLKCVESLTVRDPKKPVVKFMCPDPECNKQDCEFAHKVSELRFKQEDEIRKNYKLKLQEKIKNFQPIKRTPWVPSGSLVDCMNCHSNFLYKAELKMQVKPSEKRNKIKQLRDPEIVAWNRSKCCNKCSLEQRLKEKQEKFVSMSKEANQKILEKSGRNQYDVTGDQQSKQRELLISEKIGQYRKARTLFKQRKFVEAYDVMKIVIEMIRKEREQDCKSVEKKLNEIKNTIGLEINEPVFGEENDESPVNDKKMRLFQTQTQRLKQGSSNDFLNYQMETFFMEVEQKLVVENLYATNLRVKAGNLEEMIEGQDEEAAKKTTSFLFKPKKVKICEYIRQGKKCKKGAACEFAHFSNQLDLVPTNKVIQNLYHTSEVLDTKLKNDILLPDWKPWKDTRELPIYPALPLPKDLTKDKDLEKRFPFDT